MTFIPAGQELLKRDYHYRKLDAKELAGILRELPSGLCSRERKAFAFRWLVHRTKSPCGSKAKVSDEVAGLIRKRCEHAWEKFPA